MTAPFGYKDVSRLMGSWPIAVLQDPAPVQQIQPDALSVRATILGIRRETSDGYLVGGTSLNLYADVGGTPTLHVVSFPAGTGSGLTIEHFTLAEVIAAFQASAPPLPANTAQNSDNFLLLQSQTVGQASYLRLESITTAEGVFPILGLEDGDIALGGGIKDTQHVDPSRQVASAGQLAMNHGERFSADVFNRLAMQLGINVDTQKGVSGRRRFAVRTKETFTGTGAFSAQIGTVSGSPAFLGKIVGPTVEEIKKVAIVVDAEGNQYTREQQLLPADVGFDLDFTWDSDTEEQRVNSSTMTFVATDIDEPVYVIAVNLSGGPAVLNHHPMKIVRFIDVDNAVVDSVDPATGDRLQITEASRSGRRQFIYHAACVIDGFFEDAGLTTPLVQGTPVPLGSAAGALTAILSNDRIEVDQGGVDFTLNTNPGDLVQWTGAVGTAPWSNDGTYRVKQVINPKVIELVTKDYGPVFLNPNVGVGLGSVTVESDGDFFVNPYVRFVSPTVGNLQSGIGAIPPSGSFFIVFMEASSLEAAVDADPAALTNPLASELEATDITQQAIMRLVGPSASEFSDVLYGKEILNMDFLSREHKPNSGRHSTIHPDIIDMFPGVAGSTVTVRSDVLGTADDFDTLKIRLVEALLTKSKFAVFSNGHVGIGDDITANPTRLAIDVGGGADRPDLWVERGVFAHGLLKAGEAHWTAQASGLSSPINSDPYGVTSYRHYFDDGSIAQPQIYSSTQQANGIAGEGFLALANVLNDGAGNSFLNNLVVHANGNVGVNFGTDMHEPTNGDIPQVPLHIRVRPSSGAVELLRLEGDRLGTDPTVAMTWKPKTTLGMFAFAEMDHDNPGAAGDWFLNFATTAVMDTDSDGSIGAATFRWVAGAAAFGVGTERMRLNLLGLDLPAVPFLQRGVGVDVQLLGTIGLSLIGSLPNALIPRLTMAARQETLNPAVTQMARIIQSATRAGMRLYKYGGNFGMQLLFNATNDGANNYAFDGSAVSDAWELSYGSGDVTLSRRPNASGSPWIGSGWTKEHWFVVPGPSTWNEYHMRDGRIHFPSAGLGTNPLSTTGFANTVMGKNTVVAWARILSATGAGPGNVQVEDGFNIASVTKTTNAVTVILTTPVADYTKSLVVPMSPSSSRNYAASMTANNTVVLSARDVGGTHSPTDFEAGPNFDLGFHIFGEQA